MNNLIISRSIYKCSCQNEQIHSKDLKEHLKLQGRHTINLINLENIKKTEKFEREKSDSEIELSYSKKYIICFTFKIISSIIIRKSHLLQSFVSKVDCFFEISLLVDNKSNSSLFEDIFHYDSLLIEITFLFL